MDHPLAQFSTILMAFFAIMNPIANAPLFVALTDGLDRPTQLWIALRSVLTAFVIVAAFTMGGHAIFSVFGITLPAFRIAGGALIGLVGYHMLQGEKSSVHAPTEEDNQASQEAALGIAITPLAIPVLAGPGTITTAMSFAVESSLPAVIRVLSALAIMCVVTWVSFVTGDSLTRFLGQNAIKVVTRLMGLILAVIGVQMMIAGVRGAASLTSTS